jgi:hypothetical protein
MLWIAPFSKGVDTNCTNFREGIWIARSVWNRKRTELRPEPFDSFELVSKTKHALGDPFLWSINTSRKPCNLVVALQSELLCSQNPPSQACRALLRPTLGMALQGGHPEKE